MKAQIFYIKNQEKQCDCIASMLRKYIYADIKIDSKEVTVPQLYDKEFQDSTGYLYVKYVKSSLFYTKDFRIKINGDNKCGYLGYVYDHVSENNSLLEVNESNLEALFPAVVMMNHLVMLPEKIATGISKYPRELLWSIKPFDLGGAILVDFQNEASLINALVYINKRIKILISKSCRSYMEVYRTEKLDFSELSELLNVTVDFLKSFEKEILRRNIKFTSKITAEGTVKAERLSLVTIEITNNSEVSVDQVRIRINTPPGTMKKTVSEFFNFAAGMTQKIQFQITPKIKPYCPLEVIIDTGLDSEEFPPFPIMTILEVS